MIGNYTIIWSSFLHFFSGRTRTNLIIYKDMWLFLQRSHQTLSEVKQIIPGVRGKARMHTLDKLVETQLNFFFLTKHGLFVT